MPRRRAVKTSSRYFFSVTASVELTEDYRDPSAEAVEDEDKRFIRLPDIPTEAKALVPEICPRSVSRQCCKSCCKMFPSSSGTARVKICCRILPESKRGLVHGYVLLKYNLLIPDCSALRTQILCVAPAGAQSDGSVPSQKSVYHRNIN